ncbi:MAG: type II toxin-antitoxin system VapC family toxin [Mesorhizobium sp.]
MMFIDAAAIIAILSDEPEAARCSEAIATAQARSTSPIAFWEAVVALASERKLGISPREAASLVRRFMDQRGIDLVDLPPAVDASILATEAAERFGSGRRRLNLADCFHYACARYGGIAMLSTADEFRFTDLEVCP